MAQWIKDSLESVFWNIIGNMMPVYVMLFIAISEHGLSWNATYNALHQPFTYLILSGTYFTNCYFLISKDRNRNKIYPMFFTLFLLFVGLLIKDKTSLENFSADFKKELTVVLLFLTSFILYIFYEFRKYYQIYHSDQANEVDNQFNDLENQFDEL